MDAFELIKQFLDRQGINKVATFTGESEISSSKAMDTAVALILSGIRNQSQDSNQSIRIWNLFRNYQGAANWKDQLPLLLGGQLPISLPGSIGSDLLALIFGGKTSILNFISQVAGFNSNNAAGKVLSIAAPLVLHVLKDQISIKQLELPGFYKWLDDSKSQYEQILPGGYQAILNLDQSATHFQKSNNLENGTSSGSLWWLYLTGVIALIAGLFILLQKCNREEIGYKANQAIRVMSAVVDSAKTKAEEAGKSAQEMLDSTGIRFKDSWQALGNQINIRLGEFELNLPEKGVEIKLLDWIQSKTTKVDKTTWFNFDRILFETGNAKLNSVSSEQITNIAIMMKAIPTVEFKIGGYTDSTGDASENKKLSQDRAIAVMNALIEKGIDTARLSAEGYGAEHPVADNKTEEGRVQNRRVAIRVTRK